MAVTVIGDNTGDDYTGTEDSKSAEDNTTTNYGSSTTFNWSSFSSGTFNNSQLSFSGLSNISSSDTVSAATIGLNRTFGVATTSITTLVRKFIRNWIESEVTWDAWSAGNNWTTAGGTSQGNDIESTLTHSFDSPTSNGAFTFSSGQLATDVENMISASNYGWLLYRDPATTPDSWYIGIISSEGADGSRPYLSVTHAAAGVVYNRTLSSSINAQDLQQVYEIKLRVLLSSLDINDNLSSLIQGLISRVLSSSISVEDSVSVVFSLSVLMADSLNTYDRLNVSALKYRVLGDSAEVQDSISKIVASIVTRVLSSYVSVSDAEFTTKHLTRSLLSSLSVIDRVLSNKELQRLLTDNVDILDNLIATVIESILPKVYTRVLSDNLELQDLIIRQITTAIRGFVVMKIKESDIVLDIKASNIDIDTKE